MNAQVSEEQIRAVFRAIDIDGNGKINFDEFCHMSQKRPLKMDHNRVNQAALDQRSMVSFKTTATTNSIRSRSVNRSINHDGSTVLPDS